MKQKLLILLLASVVALVFIGTSQPQEQQRREPPQPPPVDSAAIKARMDSVQTFFDQLNASIEGKQDSPATAVFQNIKLMQKATAGRLLNQMRNWTRILGVNCTYCHTPGHWDSDDKPPKLTARSMDKFEDDVNGLLKNIKTVGDDAHVNCFTCHRGSPKPEGSGFRGGPGGQGGRRRGGQ